MRNEKPTKMVYNYNFKEAFISSYMSANNENQIKYSVYKTLKLAKDKKVRNIRHLDATQLHCPVKKPMWK